jgi:NADP-dependent 3-hydroxy acid dehydrogenase YdfG
MKTLLAGKTCFITGANSGIGKALSLALAGVPSGTVSSNLKKSMVGWIF